MYTSNNKNSNGKYHEAISKYCNSIRFAVGAGFCTNKSKAKTIKTVAMQQINPNSYTTSC
jgi:hypothetical protein